MSEVEASRDVERLARVLVGALPALDSEPDREPDTAPAPGLGGDVTDLVRSEDILARGEPGLRFFTLFAPPYSRYTGRAVDLDADVAGPYRSAASIDLAGLHDDAARFRTAAAELGAVRDGLDGSLGRLAEQWTGVAADAAVGHVTGMLVDLGSAADDVASFAALTDDLADAAAEQVRSRADTVLALAGDPEECGGLHHTVVERLVDVATEPPGADELARAVRTAAIELLDGCFVPAFEDRLEQFGTEAVTGVDDDLAGLWSDARSSVDDERGATLGTVGPAGGGARLGVAPRGSGASLGVAGPAGGGAELGSVPDREPPGQTLADGPG